MADAKTKQYIQRLTIRELGGMCPVQGFGTVNDSEWYFRARGNSWTLDVDDKQVLCGAFHDADGGSQFAAGYMPIMHALKCIMVGLGEWADAMIAEREKKEQGDD